MKEKGMSVGELENVIRAVGGIDNLINPNAKDKQTLILLQYMLPEDKLGKLFENQELIKTPVLRNGKKAAIGYDEEFLKSELMQ